MTDTVDFTLALFHAIDSVESVLTRGLAKETRPARGTLAQSVRIRTIASVLTRAHSATIVTVITYRARCLAIFSHVT